MYPLVEQALEREETSHGPRQEHGNKHLASFASRFCSQSTIVAFVRSSSPILLAVELTTIRESCYQSPQLLTGRYSMSSNVGL